MPPITLTPVSTPVESVLWNASDQFILALHETLPDYQTNLMARLSQYYRLLMDKSHPATPIEKWVHAMLKNISNGMLPADLKNVDTLITDLGFSNTLLLIARIYQYFHQYHPKNLTTLSLKEMVKNLYNHSTKNFHMDGYKFNPDNVSGEFMRRLAEPPKTSFCRTITLLALSALAIGSVAWLVNQRKVAEIDPEMKWNIWKFNQKQCRGLNGAFVGSEKNTNVWKCRTVLASWITPEQNAEADNKFESQHRFQPTHFQNIGPCFRNEFGYMSPEFAYLPNLCMNLVTEPPNSTWARQILRLNESSFVDIKKAYNPIIKAVHTDKVWEKTCKHDSLFQCVSIARETLEKANGTEAEPYPINENFVSDQVKEKWIQIQSNKNECLKPEENSNKDAIWTFSSATEEDGFEMTFSCRKPSPENRQKLLADKKRQYFPHFRQIESPKETAPKDPLAIATNWVSGLFGKNEKTTT